MTSVLGRVHRIPDGATCSEVENGAPCGRRVKALDMCHMHYNRHQRQRRKAQGLGPYPSARKPKPRATRKQGPQTVIPEVVALYVYPDVHPDAPPGQRLVVYVCPRCQHEHLVAWLPIDPQPGLKTVTCRAITGAGTDNGMLVSVLAVEGRTKVLSAPPPRLSPFQEVPVEELLADVGVDASEPLDGAVTCRGEVEVS